MATTKLRAPNGVVDKGLTPHTAFGNTTVATDGSVTVDSRAAPQLLGSGFTNWTATAGGTSVGGSHIVTAGEDTANTCTFASGLTTITSLQVQILRAGKDVTNLASISYSGGNITVADNAASYVLTNGDVINFQAIGTL